MKKSSAIFLLFLVFPSITWADEPGGLEINYGEILVEHLPLGVAFSMQKSAALPLKISNKSNEKIRAVVTLCKPTKENLASGYESIPDPEWVEIKPSMVEIKPQDSYESDVVVTIPNEDKYAGKKFQAMIDVKTIPDTTGKFVAIAMAVRGKLLVQTLTKGTALSPNAPAINLEYSLAPAAIQIKDVKPGKKAWVVTGKNIPVELNNLNNTKMSFLVQSINPKDTLATLDAGYEFCPSPDFLKVENEEISVDGKSKNDIPMSIEIPDKPEYYGKKYIFIVSVDNGPVASAKRYLRVYVLTVAKK